MSLEKWRRLHELEQAIREEFADTGCPTARCPAGPRVHLVFCHFGALVEPDRSLDSWRFATIDAYKAAAPKPREARVAADFLAAHFLWVRARDVRLDELPKLEQPVAPAAADGGTLVHFQDASFDRTEVKAKVGAPARIDDFALVYRSSQGSSAGQGSGATAGAVAGAGAAAGVASGAATGAGGAAAGAATGAAVGTCTGGAAAGAGTGAAAGAAGAAAGTGAAGAAAGAAAGTGAAGAAAGAAAGTGAAGAVAGAAAGTGAAGAAGTGAAGEDATGIPRRRRLCLSVPGSAGEHKDVDVAGATVEASLLYPVPTQHNELRLLSVSPGFQFEVGGTAVGATDPWTESTRAFTVAQRGQRLEERSSSTYVGKVVSSQWGVGIAKYASEGTDTTELANRHACDLGDSRVKVFKALRNVEGGCESVATYDGPKISWGINQWTLPSVTGELWQILAFIYDFYPEAFARRFSYYGIGLWFASRAATWTAHGTYRDVLVYRLPCCGPQTRAAIDAVFAAGGAAAGATAEAQAQTSDTPPAPMRGIAQALRLTRRATTSIAMCHVFTTAGADEDIQKAQAQWMSYRISSTRPVGKTIGDVIDLFLRSLGSNMSATARLNTAVASLGDEYSPEQVQSLLGETFSDDGASGGWIDWPTRCRDAGKST
ncbi:hypothetical protein [Nannocystis punicea]|uniref:Uncharacterized protein n=1 Tax=Nannocystis punicea TaxID=2995304 RepID=A0ABY7HBE1_9BACT|nr:hypothetical protein [Nannocystis poenicansa]WAS96591.1 hypothetical protein O0S08_10575 [Nannocystis poenicansa]